jgi:hypothetical protein
LTLRTPVLDSANHKSHTVFSKEGRCPSTHPYRIPRISYLIQYAGRVSASTQVSTGVAQWGRLADAMVHHHYVLQYLLYLVALRRFLRRERVVRFVEYGGLAIAAQRQRRELRELIERTPADGLIGGTARVNGDLFGEHSLQERIPGGASGHETDKRSPSSPPGTQLLAKGTNPDDGGAEIVVHETRSGGAVFSVGSITWVSALFTDRSVSTITRNVVNRFRS